MCSDLLQSMAVITESGSTLRREVYPDELRSTFTRKLTKRFGTYVIPTENKIGVRALLAELRDVEGRTSFSSKLKGKL